MWLISSLTLAYLWLIPLRDSFPYALKPDFGENEKEFGVRALRKSMEALFPAFKVTKIAPK